MDTQTQELLKQLKDLIPALEQLVATIEGEPIELSPELLEEMSNKIDLGICLECGEVKDGQYRRGVCQTCYDLQRGIINKKQATDNDFVMEGRRAPKGGIKLGRKAAQIPIPGKGKKKVPNAKSAAILEKMKEETLRLTDRKSTKK